VPVAVVRGLDRVKRTQSQHLSRKLLVGRRGDLFTEIE